MAFLTKMGNMLRQTASRQMASEISASRPSIYQAMRCMSSSKLFVGGAYLILLCFSCILMLLLVDIYQISLQVFLSRQMTTVWKRLLINMAMLSKVHEWISQNMWYLPVVVCTCVSAQLLLVCLFHGFLS